MVVVIVTGKGKFKCCLKSRIKFSKALTKILGRVASFFSALAAIHFSITALGNAFILLQPNFMPVESYILKGKWWECL